MNLSEKNAIATLRLHTTTLGLEEISALLKTRPTRSFTKGERMSPRNVASAVFEENLWMLESGEEPSQPLEIHILRLVDFLEQRLVTIKGLTRDCNMDIFCGYSSANGQGGFTLEAELMKRLSAIPVDISFDIYS